MIETDKLESSFHSESTIFIPPNSKFYISTQQQFNINKLNPPYDLVLMDPPWPNKSIKRKRSYQNYDKIENIPLESILDDFQMNKLSNKIVCIWITNSKRIENFVLDNFCKKYNFRLIQTIYWMKITAKNEPVSPIDSMHKKPFEKLLVLEHITEKEHKIEDPIVIFSVPSSFHSQKPFIHNWLQQKFSSKNPIELFSRKTIGNGWTNWGNEPLKFNELTFLKTLP